MTNLTIKDIKNYNELLDIIYDNEALIQNNYNSKKDQILIDSKLLVKILDFFKTSQYANIDKNELLKLVVRDVLELNSTDLIVIKKGHIFIKLYNDNNRHKVSSSEINTVANRYNGIEEDELESFYSEYFSEEEIENLFFDIALIFVQKYFLEKHISNIQYEKDVFNLIQKLIIEDLKGEFECSTEFYKGFSGYIFRKHFRLVFQFIAELLLKEIAFSNKHIIEFLKYYSSDVIVIDGRKYKVPELKAESGLKWHVVSMMALTKIYIKTQEYIFESESSIEQLENKVSSMYIDDLSPIEYNSAYHKKYQQLSDKIITNARKIEEFRDSLEILKDDEYYSIKKELREFEDERMKLREKKAVLKSNKVEAKTITQYNKLIKELETIKRSMKAKQKILQQNKDSFLSIKNALIKALISKKQLI
ncbi:MAG: hypothetical protein U9Q29_03905 [Campylobacterota bacterium]|nr:hypothetical protein [Campylobacterota bacterium]